MKVVPRSPLTRCGKIKEWFWRRRVRIVMVFASLMHVPVDVRTMDRVHARRMR